VFSACSAAAGEQRFAAGLPPSTTADGLDGASVTGRTAVEARLRAIVRGRVQGVNFRYHAMRTAQQLELTGWVANRWDGTVETVAEGSRAALLRYGAFLNRGSPASLVDQVEANWTELATGEFDSFDVRYV
jgi:acylphosphatase